jgi:hypothetical protein
VKRPKICRLAISSDCVTRSSFRRRFRWTLSTLLVGFVAISVLFAAFVAIVRPQDDITNHPDALAVVLAADEVRVQRWASSNTDPIGTVVQESIADEPQRSALLAALTNSDHFAFGSKYEMMLLDVRPGNDYIVQVTRGTDVLEYEISTLSAYAVLNGKWIGESKLTDDGRAALYDLVEQTLKRDATH